MFKKLKIFFQGVFQVYKMTFPSKKFVSAYSILEQAGISKDDTEKCMEWAFGKDWQKTKFSLIPYEWNIRHKDLFEMTSQMTIVDSLSKVAIEYLKTLADEKIKEKTQDTPVSEKS